MNYSDCLWEFFDIIFEKHLKGETTYLVFQKDEKGKVCQIEIVPNNPLLDKNRSKTNVMVITPNLEIVLSDPDRKDIIEKLRKYTSFTELAYCTTDELKRMYSALEAGTLSIVIK